MEKHQLPRVRVPRNADRLLPRAVSPAATIGMLCRGKLRVVDQNVRALSELTKSPVRSPVAMLVVRRVHYDRSVVFDAIPRRSLRMVQSEWRNREPAEAIPVAVKLFEVLLCRKRLQRHRKIRR